MAPQVILIGKSYGSEITVDPRNKSPVTYGGVIIRIRANGTMSYSSRTGLIEI